MSFWRTSPSAQEALQGWRDPRNPRSLSGSGRYYPARASGLSRPISGSILPAWLGGIAPYHGWKVVEGLRTTPSQEVHPVELAGHSTCEFHHRSLCSLAYSYQVDS
jgi:hypothetical protein